MPAPTPRQAAMPSHRTPVVLVAFSFGVTLGIAATLVVVTILMNSVQLNPPGEGRNRTGAIVTNEEGTRLVHVSSCDVFRGFSETREAFGPVRFRVEMSRVVDGDTIRVVWHGENTAVRLLGIDAPERNRHGGGESTECLRELLVGADTVDLEFENDTPRRDRLGRLLAYVWHGDVLLNLEMVQHGHAGLYKSGGKGKYGDALRHAARKRATE